MKMEQVGKHAYKSGDVTVDTYENDALVVTNRGAYTIPRVGMNVYEGDCKGYKVTFTVTTLRLTWEK